VLLTYLEGQKRTFNASGLLAKISAGADFFQTQFAFDINALKEYMKVINDAGVTEKAYYIVGLGPLASAKSAKWMDTNLFGVNIPEAVIKRIEGADNEKLEGQKNLY
jgi:5,10-methylenetetrahydrofolate reductase